jgi:hypothetical protein
MESGIGNPILEDKQPLIYIEWGWIPSIRDFLFHINSQIINATNRPLLYRQHDSYLMDAQFLSQLTRKEQILINRCRLFLQVERLSDISSTDGTTILDDWKQANESTLTQSRIFFRGKCSMRIRDVDPRPVLTVVLSSVSTTST